MDISNNDVYELDEQLVSAILYATSETKMQIALKVDKVQQNCLRSVIISSFSVSCHNNFSVSSYASSGSSIMLNT
jgi:hypothetical protein